jgi:hypothetical protein
LFFYLTRSQTLSANPIWNTRLTAFAGTTTNLWFALASVGYTSLLQEISLKCVTPKYMQSRTDGKSIYTKPANPEKCKELKYQDSVKCAILFFKGDKGTVTHIEAKAPNN